MAKPTVLVLCGGKSAERDVSLVSANTVVRNLLEARHPVRLVYVDPAGRWLPADPAKLGAKVGKSGGPATSSRPLEPGAELAKADVAFPVLHGPMGEDGTIQGLFELSGMPYVGCGVLGSAVGMDKEISKRLSKQAGLPILPYAVIHDPKLAPAAARAVGLPLFVKPARMGSSVGVSKVKNLKQLAAAVREAFLYDDKVVLEKGIEAREIETAVYGDPWSRDPKDPHRLQASVVGEITPNAEFYTYESKYLDPNGAGLHIPANIPASLAARVRELGMLAFRALDCYGLARADFLLDKKSGELWFNEVNTLPGFTSASMYPLLWKAAGVDTPKLVSGLVELALRRHRRRASLKIAP